MKIISHTNEGREYLLCEVEDRELYIKLYISGMGYLCGKRPSGLKCVLSDEPITSNSKTRILGLASEVGEDVAGEIAPADKVKGWYLLPKEGNEDSYRAISTTNAVESLASILRSHSLTPSTTLLIQKQ